MDRLRAARRLRRSRAGRVPYSLVAIIVLASILTLSTYLGVVSSYQNLHGSYDIPENTQTSLLQVEGMITQAAHFDLLNATANLLSATPFGSGGSAQLNLLNATTNAYFSGSLQSLGLTGTGLTLGQTTVTVTSWTLDVTYAQGTVNDAASRVTTSTVSAMDMSTTTAANPIYPDALSPTQENLYPMALGTVTLVAVDAAAHSTESRALPFSTTLQSEIGLLESKSAQFADDSFGPDGGFARLVSYIASTLGELRALSGYGSGGYPGPHATTSVFQGPSAVLTSLDVNQSLSLSLMLESLRYFRTFDANATSGFISSLPPGAYQALIDHYVTNGTVDAASLYLLLYTNTSQSYGFGNLSSGEGLASSIYSFADRFVYDLLWRFWNTNITDPTLTEPVVNWGLIQLQGETYANQRVVQWLTDYKNWLGVTVSTLPRVEGDALLPPLTGTASAFGGETCTYYLFPGGDVEVSAPQIQSLESLIMGLIQEVDITLANSTGFGNGIYHYYYAPGIYPVYDNLTINDWLGGHTFCEWANSNPAGQYCGIGSPEEQGYYVSDRSLLWEYDSQCSPWVGGCNYRPGNGIPYFDMLRELLLNTTASMENKSLAPTDLSQKAYLDYVAYQGDKSGSNSTGVQAGLPNLTTPVGRAQALNTSYSFLTNGSTSILQGPLTTAVNKFSTQATNNSTVDQWWINGAAHPNLQGVDSPTTTPGAAWTMTDIARMTSRLWFQELYGLWYGSAGVIPSAPWFPISYQAMDSANYNIVSTGVLHAPPLPGREPDFFMMTQNETYIEILCWMDEAYSDCNTDYEIASENGFGNTAMFAQSAYGVDNFNGPGGCPNGLLQAAYNNAMATWWDPTTGTWATWQQVGAIVTQAMDGVVNGPNGVAAGGRVAGGFATVHQSLASSWWSVKNDTGDAYWGCGYSPSPCPAYDAGNFTHWILTHIAPPIINDTNALGTANGWLSQLYRAAATWLQTGANESGTVYRPMLDQHLPYTFWYGNETSAAANEALFQESLQSMEMRVPAGSMSWQVPRATVHMVDPQDTSSSMGLAPFLTTWGIALHGDGSLELNSSRGVLGAGGFLIPTHLNLTIPLNFEVNVTVYTPWPLGSGWDPNPWPLPGDPIPVQTRGLLGIEGLDANPAPTFLPGIYVSPVLDPFFLASASASRIVNTEGLMLEGLLAGLPDRVIGGSAAWAENLTLLENVTNADLARTAGFYENAMGGYLNATSTALGALPKLLTSHDGAFNAYFGSNFELDLPALCLATFQTDQNPVACGIAFLNYAPGSALELAFSGTRTSASLASDDPYTGIPPTPLVHGFDTTWGNAAPGAHTVGANWGEFGQGYTLSLTGPSYAPALNVASRPYGSLPVPHRFLAPGTNFPAILSAYEEGCAGGGSPACAATGAALDRSALTWPSNALDFEEYVSEQLYGAGYLYDNLTGPTPATETGVTRLGYSTQVELSAVHAENYSLYLQDGNGLFGNPAQAAKTLAFLAWFELNYRALSYDMGAPSVDPTTLSSADPYLLEDAYRNVTFVEGPLAAPFLYAWSSPNLAFTLANLGGASGGLSNSPTVEFGGWTSDQGGWGLSGTLTEA